jgi:hypothetical protein
MREGFEPKLFKSHNMTLEEQFEQDKLLEENLKKGYICLSQSPMASPLPFISEIMDKLKGANILQNWTSDGDITISILKGETNGRQPLKQIEDFLN